MQPQLKEGIDFYYNEDGYVVLTAAFLLKRGYCCGNGCRHCPYDYEKVPEPFFFYWHGKCPISVTNP
ncbi:MAG: hypothetical protein H6Q26_2708 [Bacteroidetes bacterium]|nr:hypothetical protein [Bacteroidota bacterium]